MLFFLLNLINQIVQALNLLFLPMDPLQQAFSLLRQQPKLFLRFSCFPAIQKLLEQCAVNPRGL